jgi:hypothetical protein
MHLDRKVRNDKHVCRQGLAPDDKPTYRSRLAAIELLKEADEHQETQQLRAPIIHSDTSPLNQYRVARSHGRFSIFAGPSLRVERYLPT